MAAIAAGRAAGGDEATDAVGDTGKKVSARCVGDLMLVLVSNEARNQCRAGFLSFLTFQSAAMSIGERLSLIESL